MLKAKGTRCGVTSPAAALKDFLEAVAVAVGGRQPSRSASSDPARGQGAERSYVREQMTMEVTLHAACCQIKVRMWIKESSGRSKRLIAEALVVIDSHRPPSLTVPHHNIPKIC